LITRRIEKIWGRRALGLGFADAPENGEPIGEIWYEGEDGAPDDLLVKYLFTSEKLSVQVHPDDDQARARGHRSGKEECWLILDAEPGATLGIGLRETVDGAGLRAAALDGSIEAMLDWKPVATGDVFYLQAGTIHAIGSGVTLVEIQQNIDLTYRLYDYGRPRELHLDAAIAVARPGPWSAPNARREVKAGRAILAEGRKFVVEHWEGTQAGQLLPPDDRPIWIVPLAGAGSIDGQALMPGDVWIADTAGPLSFEGELLIAYPGGEVAPTILG
ncbi:MAG: class I mannose-6-phosphate isomerase, partial [Sphingomonadaceae bacterium]|nr:class I mannose-6-phosphate isomerase [Sphingomonadaceae bacterium]